MNAIIALCHFCEVHGPCPVFCTQTLRDTKIDELLFNFDIVNKSCCACNSIGNTIGMLSHDTESNANFLSTQVPVITECVTLVKQAATRSLSCEVSPIDGGFIFFGDSTRSHTLSHIFQLRDAQARGSYRLFSIIIMMKDKMFLLNIQPFLAEPLMRISKELENRSLATYTAEESKCSERANRLNTGQACTRSPRSLAELTGEEHIFARLHSHFTWILWAGARCLTETITLGGIAAVPQWMQSSTTGNQTSNNNTNNNNYNYSSNNSNNKKNSMTIIQLDKGEWNAKKYLDNRIINDFSNNSFDADIDNELTFRKCRELLHSEFVAACYCTIIGIQIVVRGPQHTNVRIIKCLSKLLPDNMHKLIRIEGKQYVNGSEARILGVSTEVAVPQPCNNIFRIDFIGDGEQTVAIKWLGELPLKWPDLLQKIMKSIDEKLFNDYVLDRHMRLLIEEWKNKVLCMKKISSNQDKIKKILGIQQQDQHLINYWTQWL